MADRQTPNHDEYAARSFSLRTKKPWQLWGITIAAAVIVVLFLLYAL